MLVPQSCYLSKKMESEWSHSTHDLVEVFTIGTVCGYIVFVCTEGIVDYIVDVQVS